MKFSSTKSNAKNSKKTTPKNTTSGALKTQNGRIKRHPDGFGFFIPEDPEAPDVYIPRQSMEGIMTNDKVLVSVERERGGDRYRGEILKVTERGLKTVVGVFHPLEGGSGLIRDESKAWGHDLVLPKGQTLNAQKGELVAAEISKYPDQGEFTGKVVQIIGDAQDPMNDIQRVLLTQNIPQKWPDAVLKEEKSIPETVQPGDIKGRKDLRHLNLITIDGATAKDFDDAIFVDVTSTGFILYVAIADVSHYVRPGSAIDDEAYIRGTSVYLPNFVVPMLPEALSNGLCSLNPHVDRLCLVAEIHMDFQGEMQRSDFYEAVMKSVARVTYGEAQEILEGTVTAKFKHVAEDIERASQLAKILMVKRFREGSLDLEIPEIQLVIDGGGNPVDILRSERLFAHRLIEEMMLAANVAVGKFLHEREIPAIYRIHEPPNADAIASLEKSMRNFGSHVALDGGKLQKRLTRALEEFHGKPEAQILNILTLRSMSQAKYSPNNLGHFGLGFEFYTHFTSPIRRYPDLIVHRLVKSQIMKKSEYRLIPEGDLATAGQMLSACEQRAVKAERQVQSIKRARFMQKFIGEEFDGMISSVTKFGVFVLLRQFEVDGLVSLDRLSKNQSDTYEFDQERMRLVASRSGEAFEIGQQVRVLVANTDIDLGQVDFELIRETKEAREARKPAAKDQAKGRMERFQVVDELNLDQLIEESDAVTPYRKAPGKSGRGQKSQRGHESSRDSKPGRGQKSGRRTQKSEAPRAKSKSESPAPIQPARYSTAGNRPAPGHSPKAAVSSRGSSDLQRSGDDKRSSFDKPTAMKPMISTTPSAPSTGFDPERKLREALAKRGLTPTEALRNPESVKRLGAQPAEERNGENSRGSFKDSRNTKRRGAGRGRRAEDEQDSDRDGDQKAGDRKKSAERPSVRGQATKKSAGPGKNSGGGRNSRRGRR